jgi:hypothetical protein
MKLDEWWAVMGYDKKYKAPLMVCPNNTIMIMPEEIRDTVIEKMRVVAGIEGRIVITYWNGKMVRVIPTLECFSTATILTVYLSFFSLPTESWDTTKRTLICVEPLI